MKNGANTEAVLSLIIAGVPADSVHGCVCGDVTIHLRGVWLEDLH